MTMMMMLVMGVDKEPCCGQRRRGEGGAITGLGHCGRHTWRWRTGCGRICMRIRTRICTHMTCTGTCIRMRDWSGSIRANMGVSLRLWVGV